jgi:hypothetical protein
VASLKKNLTAGLIGQRLIEAGYLTREQLQEALEVQRDTALLLGEVCILRGWLTYDQLRECLPRVRSRLGNRLLAEKRITMEQLWLAILEQRQSGERLGKILVARGWVDEAALQ